MEFKGTQSILAPRDIVWRCLNDPAMLQACVPGCESFTAVSEDEFLAVVVAAVGPVKAKFKGNLILSERIEGISYKISGKGEGGIAGFGKMNAEVSLVDIEGGTELTYLSTAEVGGKLAQIGSRLVSSVANKLADEFFKRFNTNVSALADASAEG
ncbi:CoxG family protein [Massilia soli]|uniref:Carbon monoxide dehydrogenase subunit G n=1 Tax=Massilia soli TaxID=2792854 RepID=A0ABS7STA0_9BURK|nr:carbon monoxide dehydrogenase subunit G [Massilia soli]MBZ2209173.1 carbon monoxide dehydrogenase subunit G [Massilia soli]